MTSMTAPTGNHYGLLSKAFLDMYLEEYKVL